MTSFPRDAAAYISQAEQDVQDTILDGGPHDPMSLALAALLGMGRTLLEGHLETIVSQRVWDWSAMDGDVLYSNGAKLGVPLRGATYATGNARLSGVAGTAIPTNLTFYGAGEHKIDISSTVPAVIGEDGTALVPIVAQVAGSIGNAPTPTNSHLGVNVDGIDTIVDYLQAVGGLDQETRDEYRKRLAIIDALDNTPGSVGWHQRRAMRFPGVTRTCIDTCNCCDGQVRLFIFADGMFPLGIPDTDFLNRVQIEVFDTPIGATNYGSMLLGRTGRADAARIGYFKIVVRCTGKITSDQKVRAKAALIEFLQSRCPGEVISKNTLINTLLTYTASVGLVTYEFMDPSLFTEDDLNVIPECDVLPIVTEVDFAT